MPDAYPKTLHHPGFRPALISVNVGDEIPKFSPAANTPVVVFNEDDEAYHLSRGYVVGSEVQQLPIVAPPVFQERKNIRIPLRNGVIEESAKQVLTEYPRWVQGRIARDAEHEKEILDLIKSEEKEKQEAEEKLLLEEKENKTRDESLQSRVEALSSDILELKDMFSTLMKSLKK